MTTDAVEWAQLEVIDILPRPRHLWERQNKWIRHEMPMHKQGFFYVVNH